MDEREKNKLLRRVSQEVKEDEEFGSRYEARRTLYAFPNPQPEGENPLALFPNGWLRKGGGAMFISVSGAGKSVAATQFCTCWAAGRDFFGIKPLHPLRIAVYQAEDDDTEVAEFRNNIRRGCLQLQQGWTMEELERAERRIIYHNVTGLSGDKFLQYVRYAQRHDEVDLLIFNPLQSFAGCDISRNDELSHFLRIGLNPILNNPEAPCGCMIIHHTNKSPKGKERKDWLDLGSAAYAGAGGAELTNWARGVLTLKPHDAQGYYDLMAAKRGARLGWKTAEGKGTLIKTIAHCTPLLFWREVSPEEAEQADREAGSKRGTIHADQLEKVVNLVTANGEPFKTKKALADKIIDEDICKRSSANKLIDKAVEYNMLIGKPNEGKRNSISFGTPDQWDGVTDEPTDDEVVENLSSLDSMVRAL